MVERAHGMGEVTGSIPVGSTRRRSLTLEGGHEMAFSLPIPNRGGIAPPDHKISPEGIRPSKINSEVFGNSETVNAARQLILWAQSHNEWRPFTLEDVSRFLHQGGKKKDEFGFIFGALLRPRREVRGLEMIIFGGGWIVEQDGKFHFTTGFIEACYRASISLSKNAPKRVIEQ